MTGDRKEEWGERDRETGRKERLRDMQTDSSRDELMISARQ